MLTACGLDGALDLRWWLGNGDSLDFNWRLGNWDFLDLRSLRHWDSGRGGISLTGVRDRSLIAMAHGSSSYTSANGSSTSKRRMLNRGLVSSWGVMKLTLIITNVVVA